MRTLLLLISCLAVASAFVAPSSMLQPISKQQRSAVGAVSMGGAATKATRVNIRNREYNKKYRSEMRTRIKRVGEAIEDGDYSVAGSLLSKAFAIIDKNVKRGIIHKNTAARKKSNLHLKVKKLEGQPPATE